MKKLLFLVLAQLLGYLVRAQPGTLDPTFSGNGKAFTRFSATPMMEHKTNFAYAMAIQSDGKPVVVGGTTPESGQGAFAVARYNTNGSLDETFGKGGKVASFLSNNDDGAYAVAIQPDGKIVAGGYSRAATAPSHFALVRYLANGSPDPDFGEDGVVISEAVVGLIYGITLQTVGGETKIVAVGEANGKFPIVRYNANGTLDTGFGSAGTGVILTDFPEGHATSDAVAIGPDNKIYVLGSAGGPTVLARITEAGVLDTGFGGGDGYTFPELGDQTIGYSLEFHDNKIYIGGTRDPDFLVARLTVEGNLDTDFSGDGIVTTAVGANQSVSGGYLQVQPDGRLVIGGDITDQDGVYRTAVVRFLSDGTLDATFDGPSLDGNGIVVFDVDESLNTSSYTLKTFNNRIYIAGEINTTRTRAFVVRLAENGNLDTDFSGDGKSSFAWSTTLPQVDYNINYATAMAIQPDGKPVVAGESYVEGGTNFTPFALARFKTDGSLDETFGQGGKVTTFLRNGSNGPTAVAIQPDGKIVVGGYAPGGSGESRFALVRYLANGSPDPDFGQGGVVVSESLPGEIYGLALQQVNGETKIVVAGYGNGKFPVARYNANGTLDTGFGPTGTGIVLTDNGGYATAVMIGPDNKIYVMGSISPQLILARFTANGVLDPDFGGGDGYTLFQVGDNVNGYSMDIHNGKIYVGGTSVRDFLIVRFTSTGDLDLDFSGDGYVTTSVDGGGDGGYLQVLPDGRIVLAGDSYPGSQIRSVVLRYLADGTLDETFDGSSNGNGKVVFDFSGSNDGIVNTLKIFGNRIYLAGEIYTGPDEEFAIAALINTGVGVTQSPTPPSATVCQGGSTSTFIQATGDGLTYKWYKGAASTTSGVEVTGQTSATLVLTDLQTVGTETYYARVIGSDNSEAWSSAFTVQTLAAPTVSFSQGNPTPLTVTQNTPSVVLTLNGCSGGTLSWNGPGGPSSSTSISIGTGTIGTQLYSATCTAGICQQVTSATVVVAAPTATGSYDGFIYGADCSSFRGWAWDRNKPNTVISVDILDGSNVLATIPANEFRQDLKDAGKGNGIHAFRWTIPTELKDGQQHYLSARVSSSSFILKDSPKALICEGGTVPPPANKPPVAPTVTPLTAQQGVNFTTTLPAFTDPEGSTLSYSLVSLPAGLTFTSATRQINGIPTASGIFVLTYSATDGKGATNSVSFNLMVNPAATTPVTGSFEGYLDKVECGTIRGWVWDRNKPNAPLTLEFYTGSTVWGSVVANIYRTDLKDAGKGNGAHAYSFEVPAVLKDNTTRLIRARVSGSTYDLKDSGKPLTCAPPVPTRLSAETGSELAVTLLGNPVSDQLRVEIRGVEGQPLQMQLTDASGRVVRQYAIEAAKPVEQFSFPVSQQPAGLLFLRVSTLEQNRTLKVVKR
ncbi:Ig-like domain-containing protein [Larkinella rosea]|nr:hypothetical protein [Larkinella rosea]